MSCYHPLKGVYTGFRTDAGKRDIKVFPYHAIEKYDVLLPCGKCIGCRLDKSVQWADRIMLELNGHDESWFLTLTYDNDHIKESVYGIDENTGEALTAYTLCKRDVQLFLKRLRKSLDYPIRYFYAGEYGPSTLRPHYHMIVFGLHLDDLKYYQSNDQGDSLYISEKLTKLWSNGHVVVGNVSWQSAAYVARYCVGKSYNHYDYELYNSFNMVEPYICMSRKPGIGFNYYQQYGDMNMFGVDSVTQIIPNSNGRKLHKISYFKRLFEKDHEAFAELKKAHDAYDRFDYIAEEMKFTDIKDREHYLQIKEDQKIKLAKSLKRNKV